MSANEPPAYSGRCLCGSITYHISGSPVIVAQCHCDECRRLSGTGHTIGAMYAAESFFVDGPLGEFKYESSTGSQVTKGFCKACGSPIFGRNTRIPDYVTVPLGTMDDAGGLKVQVVIFARDRKHWDALGDDVARFETQPDWTPTT